MLAKTPVWLCNNCGTVDDIRLYDLNLKKPGFKVAPINPTCNKCGEPVKLDQENQRYKNRILVLTGPCGSGKTSIVEHLYQHKGINAIDLDCLIDLVKLKYGFKHVDYNSREVMAELVKAIDILMHYKNDIALALIIDPDKIDKFKRVFESLGAEYKIIFLHADYHTILERTQTRTCFDSVTPEKWVRYFYDSMMPMKDITADHFMVLDTTHLSIEQTIAILLK